MATGLGEGWRGSGWRRSRFELREGPGSLRLQTLGPLGVGTPGPRLGESFSTSLARNYFLRQGRQPVRVIQGDGLESIPFLEGPYDLVFLDAQRDQYLSCVLVLLEKRFIERTIVPTLVSVAARAIGGFLSERGNHRGSGG